MHPRTSSLLFPLLLLLVAAEIPAPAVATASKVTTEDETEQGISDGEKDESWAEWAKEKITGGLGLGKHHHDEGHEKEKDASKKAEEAAEMAREAARETAYGEFMFIYVRVLHLPRSCCLC